MRTIKVKGEDKPVAFTTWTIDRFYKMTGINLYDQGGISKVFKKYSEEQPLTPIDFQMVVKLAYCAMASAILPDDAGEDWTPPFTWTSVMNGIKINDSSIYTDLLSAYYDMDIKDVLQMADSKNVSAPQEGQ